MARDFDRSGRDVCCEHGPDPFFNKIITKIMDFLDGLPYENHGIYCTDLMFSVFDQVGFPRRIGDHF